MKKVEVCVPVELVDPFVAELTTAATLAPAGIMWPCGFFGVGETAPLRPKLRKGRKPTHRKLELIVSDRLAPRLVEFIADWLAAQKGSARFSQLVVLDVEDAYCFEPPADAIAAPPSPGRRAR